MKRVDFWQPHRQSVAEKLQQLFVEDKVKRLPSTGRIVAFMWQVSMQPTIRTHPANKTLPWVSVTKAKVLIIPNIVDERAITLTSRWACHCFVLQNQLCTYDNIYVGNLSLAFRTTSISCRLNRDKSDINIRRQSRRHPVPTICERTRMTFHFCVVRNTGNGWTSRAFPNKNNTSRCAVWGDWNDPMRLVTIPAGILKKSTSSSWLL